MSTRADHVELCATCTSILINIQEFLAEYATSLEACLQLLHSDDSSNDTSRRWKSSFEQLEAGILRGCSFCFEVSRLSKLYYMRRALRRGTHLASIASPITSSSSTVNAEEQFPGIQMAEATTFVIKSVVLDQSKASKLDYEVYLFLFDEVWICIGSWGTLADECKHHI